MHTTSSDLALLRSQPHKVDLWLSIYRPKTLMAAQVTGSYTLGDYQINYYNITTGSYASLYNDLTVMVGSQPNTDDYGRIRLRSATGTYAVFAENSINWAQGQYLTFLDYIPIEAIYPRIIQDPSNATNVIFYKDYNIPYSNQNSIYGTLICAGPHRAGFAGTGTALQFYYSATGTYNVASSALTYAWTFEGGSPSSSTSFTPGNVTYSTAGHYKMRLRVTAANGAVDDTYRYVSVYNRPNEGTNVPTLKWELQELTGSRSEGGYTATVRLFENIGEIEPNALIVIFADAWYGASKTNVGGNAYGNSSIVFVGYVISDSIKFNYKESWVEFQIGSVSEVMKGAEGFSVSCETKATPTTWFELSEMTVPKAMYHYLRWHSTTLKTTDFQYTGDNRLVQYFDADRGSLYDAIDSFMRDGMLGSLVSDRQGKLWAEISPFGHEEPFSSVPVNNFTFHKQDWIGTPTIEERRNSGMSFAELGGIAYYGVTTNSYSALISNAPSTVPLYHGKSESPLQGLILNSQSQLNKVAGNYLAHNNTRFPNIGLSMAGSYLNLDIAPLEQMRLVIDQNDSVRGKSIQDLRYIIDAMEWTYDSKNQMFRPEVTLLQIATGTAGVTVQIPAVPPDGGYGYPDIDLPPLPGFGDTTPVGSTVATKAVVHDTSYGFLFTDNFDSTSPQWRSFNGGLTSAQYTNANRFLICPNGVCYCAFAGQGTGATDLYFLARAPYIGGMWTIIYSYANLASGGNRWGILGIGQDKSSAESVGVIVENGTDSSSVRFHKISGSTITIGGVVVSAGHFYAIDVSYGDGKWLTTTYDDVKVSTTGASFSSAPAFVGGATLGTAHIRAGSTGITFISRQGVTPYELWIGLNNATTLTGVDSTYAIAFDDSFWSDRYFACSSDGTYCMSRWNGKGRSSDGGYSWGPIPNLPVGSWWFDCFTGGKFVAAGGTSIRYSPDFGDSWYNKEGNYLTVAPLGNINIIRIAGND